MGVRVGSGFSHHVHNRQSGGCGQCATQSPSASKPNSRAPLPLLVPHLRLQFLEGVLDHVKSGPCYSARQRVHQEGPLVVSDGCRRGCLIPFRGLGYPVPHDVGNVQFVVFDTPHLHASSEQHGEPGWQFDNADRVSSS